MTRLDQLIKIARRAPDNRSTEAPAFFAQRLTARWLARAEGETTSMWEVLALRGLAVSVSVMIIAVAISSAFSSPTLTGEETNYTAEIFSLP